MCFPDGSEVNRGILLKVTLVDGTCGAGTVASVGAPGYGSIPVIDTMGTIGLDTAAFVLVEYVSAGDVVVAGDGGSEVATCDDRRPSSLVSDNQEGRVGSHGAIRSERDSSFSSTLITARLIRSLIRSTCFTSSSSCSSGSRSINSSSSFNKTGSLLVSDCFNCFIWHTSPDSRTSSSWPVSLVTDPR